jgi:hypothetical protein
MLLYELFQSDMLSIKQIKTVKDLLMFFKMKGINSIPTETFINELKRRGIIIDVSGLIKNLEGMTLITDANKDVIKLNGTVEKSEIKSDKKIDMDKERVSQMARSSMLRRRNK